VVLDALHHRSAGADREPPVAAARAPRRCSPTTWSSGKLSGAPGA